ncbi:hypothetical protein BDV97DRAFT_63870 [Delphinella strobiligena]|nr:hypothetical protein BDV97DRAFT_63870 [Delphinella strobiligena]
MSDYAPSHTPSQCTGFLSINRAATLNTPSSPGIMPPIRSGPSPHSPRGKPNADQLDKHRMNSNAFYQQERRRNVTPSNKDHPAFRHDQDTPVSGIPISTFNRSLSADPRSSQITTISQFLSGGSARSRIQSPQDVEQLKLIPEGHEHATPTVRGIVEDRSEHMAWDASGKKGDRTPVYIYSPKPDDGSFDSKGKDGGTTPSQERSKSPKRKLLDRFNFTRTKSTSRDFAQPPTPTENIAPKAAAFFGTSISSSKISSDYSGSASKKDQALRNFVDCTNPSSARPLDPAAMVSHRGVATYSTPISSTEQADRSGSNTGRRVVSQPQENVSPGGETKAAALARSQSLHYDDKRVPPTPLPKDTPPELKRERSSIGATEPSTEPKTPHHRRNNTPVSADETPSKCPQAVLYPDGRLSPSKNGGYGFREDEARVIEKSSSVDSMSAALHENGAVTTDEDKIKEAERDKYVYLGMLDNGHLRPSTYSPNSAPSFQVRHVYSPSIYQEDWEGNATGVCEAVSIKQQRHSSPLIGFTPSPTRSRHSNKSVTFEPRHTSHHYEIHSSPQTSCASEGVKDEASSAMVTRHRQTSSASSSSVGFIAMIDGHEEASTFGKMGKILEMKPDFRPRFGSLEPYGSLSAVPSPLHYQGRDYGGNPFSGDDHSVADSQDEDAKSDDNHSKSRRDSNSTIGAGNGHANDSDRSLRERFRAEAVEGKLDKILSLLETRSQLDARKSDETSELKKTLFDMTQKLDRVEESFQCCAGRLHDVETKLLEKDALFAKQMDDLGYNMAKVNKVMNEIMGKNEATMQTVIEELAFLEDQSSAMCNKVDAIEFQVTKYDHLSDDVSSLMPICQQLDKNFNRVVDLVGDSKGKSTLSARLLVLENELGARTTSLNRLDALEDKVRLGDRVVSFGSRLAALEQKVNESTISGTHGTIQGSGLWKRRGASGFSAGVDHTPPSSAGISSNGMSSGLWSGYAGSPDARSPVGGRR